MSKKKKHRTPPSAGKTVTGKAPMSKQKRMKPLSRGLLITAVVLIALAEVLLRVDLIGEQVDTAMYIAARPLLWPPCSWSSADWDGIKWIWTEVLGRRTPPLFNTFCHIFCV